MQEMQIVTYCDPCHDVDNNKVSATELLGIIDDLPYVVDLCESHRDDLRLSQQEDVIRKFGRPLAERRELRPKEPKGKVKDEGPRVFCPHPDCVDTESRGYKNRASMSGHFKQEHGIALASWEAQKAGMAPDLECRNKGCKEMFYSKQARSAHETMGHRERPRKEKSA